GPGKSRAFFHRDHFRSTIRAAQHSQQPRRSLFPLLATLASRTPHPLLRSLSEITPPRTMPAKSCGHRHQLRGQHRLSTCAAPKAQSAPEVLAKVEPAARAARAEATPKKKRVTRRQPPDDYRQNHDWSRDRYPGPFGGGTFFGRF